MYGLQHDPEGGEIHIDRDQARNDMVISVWGDDGKRLLALWVPRSEAGALAAAIDDER